MRSHEEAKIHQDPGKNLVLQALQSAKHTEPRCSFESMLRISSAPSVCSVRTHGSAVIAKLQQEQADKATISNALPVRNQADAVHVHLHQRRAQFLAMTCADPFAAVRAHRDAAHDRDGAQEHTDHHGTPSTRVRRH